MIILGFTGTQVGMTDRQKMALNEYLVEWLGTDRRSRVIVVHGDCVGADAQFGKLAKRCEFKIHIRPGCDAQGRSPKRAFSYSDLTYPPAPYLERNRKIVDECAVLLAAPNGRQETIRSGTWSTVRYAQNTKKPIVMFYPDGVVERK